MQINCVRFWQVTEAEKWKLTDFTDEKLHFHTFSSPFSEQLTFGLVWSNRLESELYVAKLTVGKEHLLVIVQATVRVSIYLTITDI